MAKSKQASKANRSALVDVGVLITKAIPVKGKVKRKLAESKKRVNELRHFLEGFARRLEELEGADRLGNFEIQDLMSTFNQAETLASSVLKSRDCTANAIIRKL